MHANEASHVVEFIRGFPQPNKIGKIIVHTERGASEIRSNPARWTQLARHLTATNGHCRIEVFNADGSKVFEGGTEAICKQRGGIDPTPTQASQPPPMATTAPPRPAGPQPWTPPPLPANLPANVSETLYGMMVLYDLQARSQHVYREDVLREQRELLSEVQKIIAIPIEALARVNDSQAERIAGLESIVMQMLRQYGKPVIVGQPSRAAEQEAAPEAPTMGSKVGKVLGDIVTGAVLQLGSNIAGDAAATPEKEQTDEQEVQS